MKFSSSLLTSTALFAITSNVAEATNIRGGGLFFGGRFGAREDENGALYIMSNRVSGTGNQVLVFERNSNDGTLTRTGTFETGGLGGLGGGGTEFPGDFPNGVFGTPNDALASQNSVLLSDDRQCLFVANPGSDNITSFRISNNGQTLTRVGIYDSGANFPVSITQQDNLLYIVNAGDTAAIKGYRVRRGGLCLLDDIPNSTRSFNNENSNPPFFLLAPAQASITPDGNGIVATNKGQNTLHYWSLDRNGVPADEAVITQSSGFTPFSFTFDDNGNLLVSEAFGLAPFAPPPPTELNGAVSSYSINDDGTLNLISGSVGTGQTATCWIRYFNGFAYTTNNEPPRPSVSIFSVGGDGSVSLVESVAADIEQGIDRPIDFTISDDGSYMYMLSTGSILEDGAGRPAISVFRNNGDSIELVEVFRDGLPLSTTTPNFADTQGVFGMAIF